MPKETDRDEVRQLLEADAQLVDVMPASEYEEAHLPPEPRCAFCLASLSAGVARSVPNTFA